MRRKALLLALGFMVGASMTHAQGGSIGIFADAAGSDCNLWDNVPGLCAYCVVHVGAPGVTGGQFSAPQPACFQGTYLSDGQVFSVTIGNSQTGVAIGYGGCLASPINILTIQYFCQGLTGPCCYYPVLADPNLLSGQIEVVDCVGSLHYATGGEGIVNPVGACNCVVATEHTTWGKVKAIFAE